MNFKRNRKASSRVMSLILVLAMVISTLSITKPAYAATTITSMSYYSAGDGPVISASGVSDASYGFVMPIFNGGSATWDDVVDDLHVNVKVDGVWKDIDEVSSFVYNSNWGHWHDAGFTGYWFKVGKTTELQLASKANPSVTLDYTLQFTKLASAEITSMSFTQGPILTAGVTGSTGFTYPTFNGDSAIKYEQVADDLKVFVKTVDDTDWIDIDNNAASGWIYDQNFGQFWDGPGGYWFTVTKTTYVRLQSKSNPGVFLDYTINFEKVKRNSYTLTPEGSTNLTAGEDGAVGIVLPKIDGGFPYQDELDAYVYEILIDGQWVSLADSYYSGYMYQASGYRKSSPSNQWGYWVDNIYGLWFQPVTVDTVIRVGYPTDGVKGHDCGNNYVQFNFIGNPDAPRPDPGDYENIELGSATDYSIDGWNLIWNDEFDGNALDTSKWTNQTGYYLSDDPGTWGWGNAELEYYTDSTRNTFVSDGKLTLRLLDEPATFPQDPTRVAPYSSGKVISQNKFSFKYGRIDYCAKLPTGAGIWPALWMMPNDNVYGTWASSGEIDVMEARGRVPNTVCGTIHYGGAWPSNTNSGEDYHFPEGSTFDDGFHVYSCVWSKENIKWYVDGNCYSVINYTDWYSNNAIDNPYAPFDQEFYVIMNLAAGGWFDGGIAPDASSIPCEMQVEYVRVYQAEGDTTGSYHNYGGGSISTPDPTQPSEEPTQPSEEPTQPSEEPTQPSTETEIGDGTLGLNYSDGTATFYVKDAGFADLHYLVNKGGQNNVAMQNDGNGNFTYQVTGLNAGDVIEYFFTYMPNGQGALDSAWATFTVPANGGSEVEPTQPSEEPTQSSSEESGSVITGEGYVYDAAAGKVTVTYEDVAADSAIIYIAQFNNEADAVAAYNEAVAGLPGITLPGHIGAFMTSANGVHTYTFDAAEGSYFIYGTNGLGGAGFGEKWIMGQAKSSGTVVTPSEPSTDPTESTVEPSRPNYEGGQPSVSLGYSIPEIDSSMHSDDSFTYFVLSNNTSGKYSDNEVFITIIGRAWNDNPEEPFSYLQANGTLAPLSSRTNDQSKVINNVTRNFANLGFSIADLKALGQIDGNGNAYVKVPAIRSGRMFVSYGEDICITINDGGFAGPDLVNPTDPNQGIVFDFVEFSTNNIGEFWGNTTRVDGYVFPISLRLTGTVDVTDSNGQPVYENGVVKQQPQDIYVGDLGTLEEIYARWDYDTRPGTLFEKFNHLLVRDNAGNPQRIKAPGKGEFDNNGTGIYADYFEKYINTVWNMYVPYDASNPMVFTTQGGRFVQTGISYSAPGGCNADSYALKDGSPLLVFKHEVWNSGSNSWVEPYPERRYYIHKPTTAEVLEGKGAFDHHHEQGYNDTCDLVIESQLCAAFNRGVAHINEDVNKIYSTNPNDPAGIYSNGNPIAPWGDVSSYYKVDNVNKGVFNFYAMFWHQFGVNGKAYGFCYDDVWEQSTLLYARHADVLSIDFYSYGRENGGEVIYPTESGEEPSEEETQPSEAETPGESETETETQAPVIVTPVKVTGVQAHAGDGQIELTWDDCGAESYTVRRMTTGMSSYELLTDAATAEGFIDSQGIVTNKEYYYRVYGNFRDKDGNLKEGPASDLITVSLGNPPKKVTGAVAEFKDGKIVLNWDDVGAVKYKITRYDDTRKTYVNLTFNAKAANGYVDEDIIEAERYCYRISGYFRDADGKLVSGELSDTIWVVATDKEPAKVTGVSATVTNRAVTLTWDAADGARFYKISRAAGESGSGYETRGSLITATTYTDKVAAAGTYRYKVVGYYIEPSGTWHYGAMSSTLFVEVK